MKKYLLVSFLILSVASYSKAPRYTFSHRKAGSINAIKDSIEQNNVAVIFQFNKSFKNMPIEIIDANTKQILALKGGIFDQGNLSKDGNSGDYIITILKDRTLKNSIETSINPDTISLVLNNSIIGPYILPKKESEEEKDFQDRKDSDFKYEQKSLLQDAIYIKTALNDPEKYNTIKKILDEYYSINSTNYTTNSYLKSAYIRIDTTNVNRGGTSLSMSNIIASVGGLDVTTVADGMAKFIVKRTKQELSTAFFDRFQADVNKYPDLKTIFPQTARTLLSIGEDIYMYEIYLQTLRESFKRDLATLPTNLPRIIDNHEDYFNKNQTLKAELLTAFYMAQSIQDNHHPGEIIENYPVVYLDSVRPNVKAAFQTLKLISTSLRSNNDTVYWASAKEIQQLIKDDQLLKIYLGLVLQLARKDSIQFNNNGKSFFLADRMNETYTNLQPYKAYISNIAVKTQFLEKKIQGLKKITSDSLMYENYYSVVSNSIDLMRYICQVDQLSIFKKDSLYLEKKTAIYFDYAQTASDMAVAINRKSYATAIVNASQLISPLIYRTKEQENDVSDTLATVAKKIQRYGSLIAAVASAKNSDEVNNAIEAVALPAGSSRIKRESAFNVSLNAYCGLFVGQNRTRFWSKPAYYAGITAPIGIAASWGHSILPFTTGTTGGWSSSIFISILDLGAPVAFRFSNSTDSISSIKLKDIISPGVFISWGIPKCPISFNIGCQMAPLLTAISTKENTFGEKTLRFTASVCIDLPLLNIYNKSR